MIAPIPEGSPDTYQYVPVPTQFVTDVIRYVAELTRTPPPQVDEAAELVTDSKNKDGWTDVELHRLATSNGRVYDLIRAIWDYLAEHPDEWFPTADLAAATGWGLGSVRGFPTQVKRSFKAHFGGRQRLDETRWGGNFSPVRQPQLYFRFSPETAARWQRARTHGEG